MVPETGIEPVAFGLQNRCTGLCATPAKRQCSLVELNGVGSTAAVPGQGVEPRSPGPEPGVLPLDEPGARTSVRESGFEPESRGPKPRILPLDDSRA
jgi:hypothetical protein